VTSPPSKRNDWSSNKTDSLVTADQADLWSAVHAEGAASTLTYETRTATIGATAMGGRRGSLVLDPTSDGRQRIQPIITETIRV